MIVLFIITPKIKNDTGTWGFGDLLKGLIHVYQLSKKHNFQLYVDFQYHPLSNYLQPALHPYKDYVRDNINNVYLLNGGEVESHIIKNKNNPIIHFLSNQTYSENVSQDCKDFINSILIPNYTLQTYIQNKINRIPYSSYKIIHYRVGDHEMRHGVPQYSDEVYHRWMLNVHLTKTDNTILISDSKYFKEYVKKYTHIFMFDDNPTHIGESDNMFDSLSDFFMISNADEITSYSIYDWASGFIRTPADINGIPTRFYKL